MRMSTCKIIKSPITGRNTNSKLFPLLVKEYGENGASQLYDYIFSPSFISRYGDWTNQTRDNRFDDSYLTGEPSIQKVIELYNSDDSLAVQKDEEVRKKLLNDVVLSKSNLKDFQIDDAKEAIFFFASDEFFRQYEKNHGVVNAGECFDYAKKQLEEIVATTESAQQKADVENLIKEYANILPLVAEKFSQLGITLKVSKGSKAKRILPEEARNEFTDTVLDDSSVEDESIEDGEKVIDDANEIGSTGIDNAWAVSSFSINPTSTASTRLKMRLSRLILLEKTIVDDKVQYVPKETYIRTPKLIDMDSAYTTILRIMADKPDLNEEQFIELLKQHSKSAPYLNQLISELGPRNKTIDNNTDEQLEEIFRKKNPDASDIVVAHRIKQARANNNKKYSQSEKNELLTYAKKAKLEFYLTLWNRNKQGIVEATILNANSQSIDQIIIDSWYEDFKQSGNVDNIDGEMMVTKETAKRLYDRYVTITEIKDELTQVTALSALLKEIGIPISVEGITKILNGSYTKRGEKDPSHRYLSKTKSFSYTKGDIISLKPKSYFNAIFAPFKGNSTLEEGDLKIFNFNPYEGGENAAVNYMKETLVKVYKEEAEILFSDSHKDINGNNVYAYSQPKAATNIFARIAEGISDKAKELINSVFAKDPTYPDGADKPPVYVTSWFTKGIQEGKITLNMVEGLKKREDSNGVDYLKASEKEIALDKISRVLAGGSNYRHVVGITHSDKGFFYDMRIPKITLTYDNGISSTNMDKLYNLARAETKRMGDHDGLETGNKDFDTSAKIYHFFPLMNKEVFMKSGLAEKLGANENDWYPNGVLHNDALMQRIVNETLQRSVNERIAYWKTIGIIEDVTISPKGSPVFKGLNLDAKWMKKEGYLPSIKSEDKTNVVNQVAIDNAFKQAALEYEFYHQLVAGEYYRTVGGDPANALKGKKKKDKTLDVQKTIEATKIEIVKRNAKDGAPGNELNWIILNADGQFEENKDYNYAIIEDNNQSKIETANDYINGHSVLRKAYVDNGENGGGIERTDAQEYALGTEFVDSLFAAGEINDAFYKQVRTKLKSQEDNGVTINNTLTPEEIYALILQPQKSVYVGDYKMNTGYLSKIYIKSSTIPLIPQMTKGMEIDGILQAMLKNKSNPIHRVSFRTAVKLGRFTPTKAYDDNGKMLPEFTLQPFLLSRTGFRIQQKVPYDAKKSQVVFISQMDKLLVGDILNMGGFTMNGETKTGEELKSRKEQIRIEIFELAKQELFERLDISIKTGKDELPVATFSSLEKITAYIKEEASSSTKMNVNDELSIYLREDGSYEIPLFFNNSANKFESLLTSLVSKVVLNKISGKSYVQTTSNSWLSGTPEVLLQSGIVFANNPNFDITKGLQTLRIVDRVTKKAVPGITSQTFIDASPEEQKKLMEKYEVLPAQVVVPFKFRDNAGKLLNLKDFLKQDGSIDHNKLPLEVLRLIAARIPNQSHSSMLPIEIVGFVPIKADMMIVPAEVTKSMGADENVLLQRWLIQ